jgi:hypothetical protein
LFSIVAPFLLPSLLPRALAVGRLINDEVAALLTAAALAPGLEAEDLAALLDRVARVANEGARARVVVAFLPHLPDDLLPAARTVIEGITEDPSRAQEARAALAQRLTGREKIAVLERAVTDAASLDGPEQLVRAFEALVPQLSGAQLTAAVETLDARLAGRPESRVRLLAAAAAHAGGVRQSYVASALALIPQLSSEEKRMRSLCVLAPVLGSDERSTAETLADEMEDAFARATVYTALAAAATDPKDAHDLAVQAMKQMKDFAESEALSVPQQQEIIAAHTFRYLDAGDLAAILDLIASFEDSGQAALALAGIASRLSSELIGRAVEIVEGFPVRDQPRPLLALAGNPASAPGTALLGQALDTALKPNLGLFDDDTLAPLAQRLAELPLTELAPLWQRAVDALADWPRPHALAKLRGLAPVLLVIDGPHGARECLRALWDVRQWWP